MGVIYMDGGRSKYQEDPGRRIIWVIVNLEFLLYC